MKLSELSFSILYSIYTGIMPLIMSGLASIWAFNNLEILNDARIFELGLIWISFSIAMGLSLIPTTFVALLSGFIWGFSAVIPLVISYIIATIIGASLSKWIDNNKIINQLEKNSKAKAIISKLQNEQFKIVALARLSPVFPFGISNVVFTYLGVPIKLLLYAGIVGMLPRTLFMVWLASEANSIQNVFSTNWRLYLQSPLFIIGILSMFVLLAVVYKAVKKI